MVLFVKHSQRVSKPAQRSSGSSTLITVVAQMKRVPKYSRVLDVFSTLCLW